MLAFFNDCPFNNSVAKIKAFQYFLPQLIHLLECLDRLRFLK